MQDETTENKNDASSNQVEEITQHTFEEIDGKIKEEIEKIEVQQESPESKIEEVEEGNNEAVLDVSTNEINDENTKEEVDTTKGSEEPPSLPYLFETRNRELINRFEELDKKIEGAFESLSKEFQAKLKIDAHKDEIIDRLHSEVEKYKNDFVRKLLTPALNELILLHDDILKTLTRVGDNGSKALDELTSLPTYIKDALFNLGVTDYVPVVNEETFSPRAHKIMGLIPTGDKEMDRKIAEVSKCGFMFEERVLRVAIVKVYKYDETLVSKEENVPSTENADSNTSDSISENQNV